MSKKKIILTLLKAAVSITIILLLLSNNGLQSVIKEFKSIHFGWFTAGLIIMLTSCILGSLQWHLILKAFEINIKVFNTIKYYFTGLFFNNFLLGFVGGDLFRIYDIAKTGEKKTKALSTIFIDRFIGFITMMIMALLLGISMQSLNSNNQIMMIIGVFSLLIAFVIFFFYYKPFAKKFESLGEAVLPKSLHGHLHYIYNLINQFKNQKSVFWKIFLISFIVQGLRISVHYFACLSLGERINPLYFFVFIPIVTLIMMIPFSIGGIGLRESSAYILFGYVGLSKATAISMELIAFFLLIISSLPGGLVFVLRGEKNA